MKPVLAALGLALFTASCGPTIDQRCAAAHPNDGSAERACVKAAVNDIKFRGRTESRKEFRGGPG